MNDLATFKNTIYKYAIVAAGICELVSLPFLGVDVQFLYGLILGTAVSIVNFQVMEYTFKKALAGSGGYILISYIIRLFIYGFIFFMSIKTGLISGLGTLLGFLTIKLSIYYLHGFKSKFSKGRTVREEPDELKTKKHWYDYKEDDELDERED